MDNDKHAPAVSVNLSKQLCQMYRPLLSAQSHSGRQIM